MKALSAAKQYLKSRSPFLAAASELRWRIKNGEVPIYLDYPISPMPRYGWGRPPHQLLYDLIDANRPDYARLISQFSSFKRGLERIPSTRPDDASVPYWLNGYVMGLDPVSLYAFPSLFGSKLYIEIGSGNSTRFVRRSIRDNQLNTRIVSIDPEPRAEVDLLCDEIIRTPLEAISLDVFDELREGDILMVDNSHRCFQNSDVTVVFLDILPRLRPGVLIYIDDIYLPYDYPPRWARRYYSEQYLLAVLLLSDARRRYETLFPGFFISMDIKLKKIADNFWRDIRHDEMLQIESNGFWMLVSRT